MGENWKIMFNMPDRFSNKSTNTEIRERFDKDVARFSSLETGQQSTIDAPLSLELITDAAKAVNPEATSLLDIGCGAGNYSLKMLEKIPDLSCTLLDLSMPMLRKAQERVSKSTKKPVKIIQQDIREAELPQDHFDIILAGAVLHHLRDERDWAFVFQKLFSCLKAGGSLWISDLVLQENEAVNALLWAQYAEYLEGIGGEVYKDQVLAYIEKEDSPRSLNFQLDLMKKTGFREVEILHKKSCFAAFGGIK